jgi:hypothetical protein
VAFSNARIYDGALTTFPGVIRDDCLRHVVVASDGGAGEESSVASEAAEVVDLVLEHARRRPEESLGVIALGIRHSGESAWFPGTGSAATGWTFAAAHPAEPGRMVLAIEAGGMSYRDSRSTGDRDRLRKEYLEWLGWTFHRIWSTNWFHDPESEIAKVQEAYHEAVAKVPPPAPDSDSPPPEPATERGHAPSGTQTAAPGPEAVDEARARRDIRGRAGEWPTSPAGLARLLCPAWPARRPARPARPGRPSRCGNPPHRSG